MSKEEKELLVRILEQMDRRLNFNMAFIGAMNHEVKKLVQESTGQSVAKIDEYMNALIAEMAKLSEDQQELQAIKGLIEEFKDAD
jgi:hypothetical protein